MFTLQFLKDMLERAIKTFAQTLLALVTVIVMSGGGLHDVNWTSALSISLLATLASFLTSLASSTVRSSDTASLVD